MSQIGAIGKLDTLAAGGVDVDTAKRNRQRSEGRYMNLPPARNFQYPNYWGTEASESACLSRAARSSSAVEPRQRGSEGRDSVRPSAFHVNRPAARLRVALVPL